MLKPQKEEGRHFLLSFFCRSILHLFQQAVKPELKHLNKFQSVDGDVWQQVQSCGFIRTYTDKLKCIAMIVYYLQYWLYILKHCNLFNLALT